jgi:hypothetical protein
MKTLTEIEALQMTVAMWRELEANPRLYKSETQAAKAFESEYERELTSTCGLCEYVTVTLSEQHCRSCPLFSLWDGSDLSPCIESGSVYSIWNRSWDYQYEERRSAAAKQIADAAEAKLAELLNR